MGYTEDEKQNSFAEITNAVHKLSKTFYFIKLSFALDEQWIFLFCVMFFAKKRSFPAKTAVVFIDNFAFFQIPPAGYDQ